MSKGDILTLLNTSMYHPLPYASFLRWVNPIFSTLSLYYTFYKTNLPLELFVLYDASCKTLTVKHKDMISSQKKKKKKERETFPSHIHLQITLLWISWEKVRCDGSDSSTTKRFLSPLCLRTNPRVYHSMDFCDKKKPYCIWTLSSTKPYTVVVIHLKLTTTFVGQFCFEPLKTQG